MKTFSWVAAAAMVSLAGCGSVDPLAPDASADLQVENGAWNSHAPGEPIETPCLLTAPPPAESGQPPHNTRVIVFHKHDCPDAPPFSGGLIE